ncbi:ABC transporter permease [Candidatus Dependentiae bacterium]|nr:ABC transporter permease [Candidatus Dependentiae bacterium]
MKKKIAFWAFIKKESYHILRDYRTLIILFGMPVIQIMLFGFAITNELNYAKIGILDNSKNEISSRLISKILSSGYFDLHNYFQSYEDIDKEFAKGKIKAAIIIPEKFGNRSETAENSAVHLILDSSEPNTSNLLTAYISSIIKEFNAGFLTHDKMMKQIIPEVKMRYNPELKSVYMFVPGLMSVILMLVSALMTSISITREKELGTMEILLVSPLKPVQIILGKVIPYIFLSFMNAVIILLLGRFVFEVPVFGNTALLLAECVLFIFTALSLGIMISSITSSQQTAMMIALVALMMPTILLSGFIFPIKNMPQALQILTNIIPAKWFIIIIKNIMLKGVGLNFVWKETLILFSMTLIFIFISVKKFKDRIDI